MQIDSASLRTVLPESPSKAKRSLYSVARDSLAVFGLGVIVFHTSFALGRIRSGSMAPTLVGEEWTKGDVVLSERWTFRLRAPRRWEVVNIRSNNGEYVCKRIIGLPGETVLLKRDGVIEIDGRSIPRPAHLTDLKYLAYGNMMDGDPFPCGQGYYVLGDDSQDSDDSRFGGTIPLSAIESRAWLIVSPSERFGWVR
ncbi:MAG: signal peptidase I [Planctomycetota bacterium]|nr:signal peptidase I [Planctomycetota bacterium]